MRDIESVVQKLKRLSRRELEVLRERCQGKSIADIADSLVIVESTVKRHLSNIYVKLELDYLSPAARNLELPKFCEALGDELAFVKQEQEAIQLKGSSISSPTGSRPFTQDWERGVRKFLIRLLAIVVISGLIWVGVMALVTSMSSSSSINDNFAEVLIIDHLPYTDNLNLISATKEIGEPLLCSSGEGGDQDIDHTVWYRFTPTTTMGLLANIRSEFETSIIVYSGSSLNSLTRLGCVTTGGNGRSIIIPTPFIGGATYYLQVGGILGGNTDIRLEHYLPSEVLGSMPLSELKNDNFADALVIDNLPFTDSLNLTLATTEVGEPLECSEGACVNYTIWYQFTPATTTTLVFDGDTDLSISLASYKGSSFDPLIHRGTISGGGQWNRTVIPTTFFSGTTYYLQIGGILGGNIDFKLEPYGP